MGQTLRTEGDSRIPPAPHHGGDQGQYQGHGSKKDGAEVPGRGGGRQLRLLADLGAPHDATGHLGGGVRRDLPRELGHDLEAESTVDGLVELRCSEESWGRRPSRTAAAGALRVRQATGTGEVRPFPENDVLVREERVGAAQAESLNGPAGPLSSTIACRAPGGVPRNGLDAPHPGAAVVLLRGPRTFQPAFLRSSATQLLRQVGDQTQGIGVGESRLPPAPRRCRWHGRRHRQQW